MLNYQKQTLGSLTSINSAEVHSSMLSPITNRSISQQSTGQQHEDNVCGKTLLNIVARGSAIITELNRLIELVPAPFKHYGDNTQHGDSSPHYLDENKRFTTDNLVCDFKYFKNAEAFEAVIEANEVLKKADEDFCDGFVDVITRFYLTFESIQRYASDLNNFIVDLEEDTYVGQSLEGLLTDTESRQQLCEAYFLLGYMLMTTDNNFEGGLRERLIVSYYRYSSYKSSPDSSLDDTCNLMRSTGFRSAQQQIYKTCSIVQYHRPTNYPETFFSRVGVNQSVVNLLIAKLQSIDIYNQTTSSFPHPDHRSAALSQQASMLYVILYFCPNILSSQRSRMREITDKFFFDNWVISINMGEIVNLIEAWEPYRAARESLEQLLEIESVQNLVNQYNLKFYRVSKQLDEYLREGWLNERSVLDSYPKILNSIRDANVILKWMLLQSQMNLNWNHKLTKSIFSLVKGHQPNQKTLYKFLQNLSELEKRFSLIYNQILSEKDKYTQENKIKADETLNELIEIFNDTRPMRWVQVGANMKLASLLVELKSNLQIIDFNQANARDSIINLINQIELSQESYSDGKNLQVVQLFMATKDSLLQILRATGLSDDIKILLHSISDFSYAWRLLDETFTRDMQQMIKNDPLKVYGIESIFLKLASAFDNYLIRIQQINSHADLVSVTQYYSTKLVSYVRDVLHIIPETILELVSSIVAIQTEHTMVDLPSKVPLDSLKDYALPDVRFKMLELTSKVSHYAESMLMMQDTTIGLIRINSKQLLEDGIRRELVKRMSDSIQEILQFSDSELKQSNNGQQSYNALLANNLFKKLHRLDMIMNGYKHSFEYIQDYLFIYGLRMWQEELSRIVKFTVEQATEAISVENYIKRAYHSPADSQRSIYQSTKAPIPIYSNDPLDSSFIYRILQVLLRITDPRMTIYDEQMGAWYEQNQNHNKVLDLKVFEVIASSLCITGLNGLDQLCSSMLSIQLQRLDTYLLCLATGKSLQSNNLMEVLASVSEIRDQCFSVNSKQTSKAISTALSRVAPYSEKIINHLLRIGQLQIIRSNISCVLTTKCRYEARNLYNCLETLNTTLIAKLNRVSSQQQQQQHPKEIKTSLIKASTGKVGSNSEATSRNDENITTTTTTNTVNAYTAESTSLSAPNEEIYNHDDDDDDHHFNGVHLLEESQLMFDLTNHLEWIGLSDPLSKVYTLSLNSSNTSQAYIFRQNLLAMDLMFLILLDQSSKFQFSRSISGFVPKQSRSFYESSCTVDGQPLFYGLITLVNHYQPYIECSTTVQRHRNEEEADATKPLKRLLDRMSIFVKCTIDQMTSSSGNVGVIRPQDLTLELANMILSMVELVRLARQCSSSLISDTLLPEFILNTFQFTICHLNSAKRTSTRT